MENQEYKSDYDTFISDYNNEQMDGEKIGMGVVKMCQHFIQMNMAVADAEIAFNKVSAEKVQEADENTGKPISVAKAEILTKSTEEYSALREAKMHKENCEQAINALKSLQRGVTQEMSYAGA